MDCIDLNVGPAKNKLDKIFDWLIPLVENQNISLDSTNSDAIEQGLKLIKNPENCFINSTSKDEEKKIDEKLQAAKSYYNKYTSEMNDLIRAFPSNIVSRMHGFDVKTFFDGKNMQDEVVDDFKL